MAKQVRSEMTRAAIIRGAAEAFDRFGYGGTSLSDVIALAGVTKGALYFHFSSKQELARAVIQRQHSWSVGPAKEQVESDGPGLASVIQLSQRLANQLVHDPVVRAGVRLTLETGTFDTAMPDPYEEWIAATTELLHRAAHAGDLRPMVRPETLARYVVGAFTGVQVLSQVLTGRGDLPERILEMWELLLPALVPERKLAYFQRLARTGTDTEETLPAQA
ncbi:MAG TPA: ScbR family autoregulator-binding transcription factor [Amycolatopsis sp.]|nr:ScbR family autoregulator-binding transcription factor [Amycolatopsis sp.]